MFYVQLLLPELWIYPGPSHLPFFFWLLLCPPYPVSGFSVDSLWSRGCAIFFLLFSNGFNIALQNVQSLTDTFPELCLGLVLIAPVSFLCGFCGFHSDGGEY